MRWRVAPFFHNLSPLLAFLLPLSFYLPSLWTSYCFFSDSGDFLTASALLTIPHPTGYPWYCLLGRLFLSLIPFGEAPWRMALMTALFSAAASLAALHLLRALNAPDRIALPSALAIAFGRHLWVSSLSAEVYSANLFLLFFSTLSFVRFQQTGDRRWLLSLALAVGFGFSHHGSFTLGLFGALLLTLLVYRRWDQPVRARDGALFFIFCLLPLLFHLYLPIRAAKPIGYRYWQETGDDPSRSLRDFFAFITAQRYRHRMTAAPWLKRWQRLAEWWKTGSAVYGPLFVLGPTIFVWMDTVPPWWLAIVAGFVVSHLLFFTGYDVPDLSYFFIPSWSLTVVAGALALSKLNQRVARFPFLRLGIWILVLLSAEFSLIQGATATFVGDRRRGRRYLENVFRTAPKGAVIIATADDVLFNLWAMQTLEGRRKDLEIRAIYQWNPAFPLLKPVVSTSADLYRFGDLGPWRLIPYNRWLGQFVPADEPMPSSPCRNHRVPTVHRSWMESPAEGVHSGTLVPAHARVCVRGKNRARLGYLWIVKATDRPLTDDNGPASGKWVWWWFLRILPDAPEGDQRVFHLDECLPIIYDAPIGRYEVRGVLIPAKEIASESATVFRRLWIQSDRIATVAVWGR